MSSNRLIYIVGLVCRCEKMNEVKNSRAVRREGPRPAPEAHRYPDRVHRGARAGCHDGFRFTTHSNLELVEAA